MMVLVQLPHVVVALLLFVPGQVVTCQLLYLQVLSVTC